MAQQAQNANLAGPACPYCGLELGQEQLKVERRLARCRGCGQVLRLNYERAREWPVSRPPGESAPTPFPWGEDGELALPSKPVIVHVQVEPAVFYPYPNLQCPYCEAVNRDTAGSALYCANCGQDLKKKCLSCGYPIYVLDQFCTTCRTDQTRAWYELEAVHWKQYNDGVRLAEIGRWQEAREKLAAFFEEQPGGSLEEQRRKELARTVYEHSILPTEGENRRGFNLYWQAVDRLEKNRQREKRRLAQRRFLKVGLWVAGIGLLAFWSANALGAWWAIFVILPLLAVFLLIIVLLLLGSMGFGIG